MRKQSDELTSNVHKILKNPYSNRGKEMVKYNYRAQTKTSDQFLPIKKNQATDVVQARHKHTIKGTGKTKKLTNDPM